MARDHALSVKTNLSEPSRPPTRDAQAQGLGDNRHIRSIPPWVRVTNRPMSDSNHRQSLLRPASAATSNHHYLPAPINDKPRGRRWDSQRDAEPAMLDHSLEQSSEVWVPFLRSGPQAHPDDVRGARLMSDEWMEDNMAAWSPEEHVVRPLNEKSKTWLRRGSVQGAKRTLLKNPFIPLVFRMIVITFTLAAMGLGARLWHQTRRSDAANPDTGCSQRPSTYMAIILDCIAVPYIIYVTWDEYTSKPLGLRSATAKTSLLLIDLYFVVFYSSNLTLAFSSLTDSRWACFASESAICPQSDDICDSQSGLVSVLFVALVAWLITFSISVLRVVKRLRPDE